MRSLWRDGDRLRAVELSPLPDGRTRVSLDGADLDLAVERLDGGRLRISGPHGSTIAQVTVVETRRFVRLGNQDFVLERESGRRRAGGAMGGGLEAPMPGLVTRVLVGPGDAVKKGQPLVALEAMKMEHLIRAPSDGRVRAVSVEAGQMVKGGVAMVEMESEASG